MEVIFEAISYVIQKYSYGPCIAIVADINSSVRACCIKPFNYYFLNIGGKVIVILPSHQALTNQNGILLSYKGLTEFVNTWTAGTCERLINHNAPQKFVLFRDTKNHRLVDIINRLIEKGIFSLA